MISHIRSVALGVPDMQQALEFYEKHWRLELVARDDDRAYLGAACEESHVLRLRSTDQSRVDLISFAVATAAEVDAIAARVIADPQARLVEEPGTRQDLGGGYATRFLDCDGRTVEVSAAVATREFEPVKATDSRPKAISHLVLNTDDVVRSKSFYERVLGFQVSDWLENYFCFLRSGPAHHLIAFTQSSHASLNHVAFEVLGVDEFMRATGAMMRRGFKPIWGPGRHGIGDNTFSYFQDPTTGFVMEYTTALQIVDDSWQPQVHSSDDQQTDLWGTSNDLDDAIITTMHGRPDAGLWCPPPR